MDNPWISTASGRKYHFMRPSAEEIDLHDIAASLSKTCRFTGHPEPMYSVAQHSVLVSRRLPEGLKLAGLMHDAHEAYIGDMSRPMKLSAAIFSPLAHEWLEFLKVQAREAIAAALDVPAVIPPEVKAVDMRMLATEARDLMPNAMLYEGDVPEPYDDISVVPVAPCIAERVFLCEYAVLVGKTIGV